MARILIVEDHPDTAIVLTTELGVGGHDVESAGDGSDALDRLARRSYDLVILDLVLPKLSGEAVLRRIRERHDSTLVLILSGKDTLADRVAGLGLGADDYLTKPFEMAELLARVETLLRRAFVRQRKPMPRRARSGGSGKSRSISKGERFSGMAAR
jgi:DNA-binding response OmpR family regulator